jgi:hypothetical protein
VRLLNKLHKVSALQPALHKKPAFSQGTASHQTFAKPEIPLFDFRVKKLTQAYFYTGSVAYRRFCACIHFYLWLIKPVNKLFDGKISAGCCA